MESKYSLNEFITEDIFVSLVGCTMLVTGSVELFKQYIDINSLCLNLIISSLVTMLRIAIVGDFSFKGLLIGILNLIPIMLGATGTHQFVKNIFGR